MKALDCYFEALLGMRLDGKGGCIRTAERERAHAPFGTPFPVAELYKDGVVYRSISPNAAHEGETEPPETLGGRALTLNVLTVPAGWTPRVQHAAVPLDAAYPICGAARLPKGGRDWGVLRGGRFVGWASASCCGAVWNVTVETDRAHRRQGIALDCLTALTVDLARIGATPMYLCETDNRGSLKTALSAGYVRYGNGTLRLARGQQ